MSARGLKDIEGVFDVWLHISKQTWPSACDAEQTCGADPSVAIAARFEETTNAVVQKNQNYTRIARHMHLRLVHGSLMIT